MGYSPWGHKESDTTEPVNSNIRALCRICMQLFCETYIFTYFSSVFVPFCCWFNMSFEHKKLLFFLILLISFLHGFYVLHPIYKTCESPRLSGLPFVFLLKHSWFSLLRLEFRSISLQFLCVV